MSEPKRDRWGRYILTDPGTGEEQPWVRATTIAKTIDSMYGLHAWEKRMQMLGLAARPDLLDLAYASDPEDKKQLDELCEKALEAAKSSVKSHQGTALHKFTARLDSGQLSRSPAKWDEDLHAYLELKKREGIETHPLFVERITVVPALGCAGTMDRIVRHQGIPKIADLKTGGSLEHAQLSIAMQLAIYAHGAGLWNEQTGKWGQMPKGLSLTEGLVIHLPAGEANPKVYPVDLVKGWEMAKIARLVYDARKDRTYIRGLDGNDDESG